MTGTSVSSMMSSQPYLRGMPKDESMTHPETTTGKRREKDSNVIDTQFLNMFDSEVPVARGAAKNSFLDCNDGKVY